MIIIIVVIYSAANVLVEISNCKIDRWILKDREVL